MAKVKFFDPDVVAGIQEKQLNTFHKYLNAGDFLISKIKEMIFSGQSPVSGFNRFQKYSPSYLEYLKGNVRFITVGGKVVPIQPKYKTNSAKGKKGEHSPLNFSKIASGRSSKSSKVEILNRGGVRGKFEKPFPNKKISPVNLYATGEMMDSLKIKKDTARRVIWVGFFGNKIAQYHDKLGAGKSKVIRRLLPTRQGEKFKPNINIELKRYAKQSLQEVLNDNRLALTIKFVFSTKR